MNQYLGMFQQFGPEKFTQTKEKLGLVSKNSTFI